MGVDKSVEKVGNLPQKNLENFQFVKVVNEECEKNYKTIKNWNFIKNNKINIILKKTYFQFLRIK